MKLQNYNLNNDLIEVGIVDDRDVPFHRLTLTKGTTYNSYLYKTKKPTIIDTVDMMYGRAYIENLKEQIDLNTIEYIVINHTEPDHSGALAILLRNAPNATIVCDEKAVYHIKELYRATKRKFLTVKTGDTLDIGGKTLKFFSTPNLHTEETILTYCVEDKILFSCDIFSTHVATDKFTNTLESNDIDEDFKVYYDLIMSPHKVHVQKMLEIVKGLDIEKIATSHGYILDKDVKKYINIYDEKSKNEKRIKKVSIVYTTMRGITKKIATMLCDNFNEDKLFQATVFNADKIEHDEILKEIETSDIVLIGSSTKYGDMIGSIEKLISDLPDLTGKTVGTFGSFGWSGEGIEIIQDLLLKTKGDILTTSKCIGKTGTLAMEFPLRVRFSIEEEDVEKIKNDVTYIKSLY